MTLVKYDCKDREGNHLVVNTFPEAKRIASEGGAFTQMFEYVQTYHEAYCRTNGRAAGDLR